LKADALHILYAIGISCGHVGRTTQADVYENRMKIQDVEKYKNTIAK
jgi:hypothetical protein